MEDQEIIAARVEYEHAVWASFGQAMRVSDPTEARLGHNERCAALLSELHPEVVATLRPWQRHPDIVA